MTTCKLIARNVYGTLTFYPNDDHGKALCELAGRKVWTMHMLLIARQRLGITFVVEGEPLPPSVAHALGVPPGPVATPAAPAAAGS